MLAEFPPLTNVSRLEAALEATGQTLDDITNSLRAGFGRKGELINQV
jgi:hypothetical protein